LSRRNGNPEDAALPKQRKVICIDPWALGIAGGLLFMCGCVIGFLCALVVIVL
jgi:hypothetical protein